MSGESGSARRYRRLLAAIALLVCAPILGAVGHAETPQTKPRSTRKVFDLTPPRPGEILANPAKGTGAPPQLKEFAPSAAMRPMQDVAASDNQTLQGAPPGAAAETRSLAAGPPVQLSHLQMQLTEEITERGIDGFLAQSPQAASPQERQYWETVRREIATSLATWTALYAPAASQRSGAAAPVPPRTVAPKP